MLQKIILYLSIVFLFVTIAFTSAYAYWRIDFKAESNSNLAVGYDDIAENYSFNEGSAKINSKSYTLYLFPSTIYLDLYLDYLEGNLNELPEESYGFISPLLKEDGSIDYDEAGLVQYQSSHPNGDDAFLDDFIRPGGLYEDTYLYDQNQAITNYYESVYENSNWLAETGAESYDYGDPVYDQTRVSYNAFTSYEEQHNYRNLHRYDRFGYWPKVGKGNGRYLPLKIVVNENFSSSFYEEVVKRPLADMGDPRGWYCYSFTLWSYVSILKNSTGEKIGFQAPYYARNDFVKNLSSSNKYIYSDGTTVNTALSSFCPTTVSQYFDLMGDFSAYADEEGVIRLFPKFSNGKTYSETNSSLDTTGKTNLACGFLNGGTDAMRMTPTYNHSSVFDQHDYYFSYLTDMTSFDKTQNIGVGILTNVLLENYNALNFQVVTTIGYANWGSGWSDVYHFDKTQIEEIIEDYGEGFYNVYLFLGEVGVQGTSSKTTFNNFINTLKTASKEENMFTSLVGKNFYEPASPSLVSKKSIAIAFEKVRDARIIMNMGRQNIDEQAVQESYQSTNQYFRYLSSNVYTTSAGLNVVENINNATPINQKYQYCYYLNGVDFTNANTPNFQIRFQKRYRNDLNFRGTGGVNDSTDPAPNVDLIYEPTIENNQGIFEKEQRFINAFEYYFNASKMSVNKNGVLEEQIVFQLKNEEYKGVYDFILIFIPNDFYTTVADGKTIILTDKTNLPASYKTHEAGIYLYAYRQTNVFLKILANNPTQHYQLPQGDEQESLNGFLIHSKSLTNNMLIFQKEYALGTTVKANDKNEGTPDYSVEYLSFNQPQIDTMLAYCLNTYIQNYINVNSDPPSIERIILRDHVTGAIVAHYELVPIEQLDLEAHQNDAYYYFENDNYYQLVFENFYIRKNYVFYVTTF